MNAKIVKKQQDDITLSEYTTTKNEVKKRVSKIPEEKPVVLKNFFKKKINYFQTIINTYIFKHKVHECKAISNLNFLKYFMKIAYKNNLYKLF